jgi:hypothetical protein
MASLLKGIPVDLYTKTSTGTDAFNRPITTETKTTVQNVLVAPLSQTGEEIVNELSLNGKKAKYQLAIPKGDANNWEDAEVEFFGIRWKTIGFSTIGIDDMIPLDWNRKVLVERCG